MSDNSDKTRRNFIAGIGTAATIGTAGCTESDDSGDSSKDYIDEEQVSLFDDMNISERVRDIYPVMMNDRWFIRLETTKNGLVYSDVGLTSDFTPTKMYITKGSSNNLNRVSELYEVGTVGSTYDIPIFTERSEYFPQGESSKEDILSNFRKNKYYLVIHLNMLEDPATNISSEIMGVYQKITLKDGRLELIGETKATKI